MKGGQRANMYEGYKMYEDNIHENMYEDKREIEIDGKGNPASRALWMSHG